MTAKRDVSLARRMSQATARATPPPTQGPSINATTGILYASTTRGRFYSLDVNGDPTNTFTEILPATAPSGTDNTYGLQLAFNLDYSTLFGHNYETGDWYTMDLNTKS